jgi:hypothetical protein
MSELLVFQLEFTDKSRLEDAFQLLLEEEGISSCSVEPDSMTARFMAGPATGGRLVERIYAIGGLRWCSRHIIQRQDR